METYYFNAVFSEDSENEVALDVALIFHWEKWPLVVKFDIFLLFDLEKIKINQIWFHHRKEQPWKHISALLFENFIYKRWQVSQITVSAI